ncbi:hypothetical protein SynSYN20_01853 [Synechococcus sp. SYN20]|nr:hypothetical protein SynSYN20_01853 [Synechococcus sp. SYN20]
MRSVFCELLQETSNIISSNAQGTEKIDLERKKENIEIKKIWL